MTTVVTIITTSTINNNWQCRKAAAKLDLSCPNFTLNRKHSSFQDSTNDRNLNVLIALISKRSAIILV